MQIIGTFNGKLAIIHSSAKIFVVSLTYNYASHWVQMNRYEVTGRVSGMDLEK